jgi:hypothetical protein
LGLSVCAPMMRNRVRAAASAGTTNAIRLVSLVVT